ncbi:hypothetical protein OIO90_001157 [Microbotryomycetes sp. JL221]|nr:hypothetical protein OIO90_001157 [Microbotryomycetes sp. JL221]
MLSPTSNMTMTPQLDEKIKQLVLECLDRLVVFKPTSMYQLAQLVNDLPTWYMSQQFQHDIRYIIIDGMSQFAWQQQWQTEQQSARSKHINSEPLHANEDDKHSKPTSPTPAATLRSLVSGIAKLKQSLCPITFITQWVFVPSKVTHFSQPDHLPFYSHHLQNTTWPLITKPLKPFKHVTTDQGNNVPLENPLKPPGQQIGTDKRQDEFPTFDFDYHITCHPPRVIDVEYDKIDFNKMTFRQTCQWYNKIKQQRNDNPKPPETKGFRCVLRRRGGVELGSWEWDHLGDRLII